MRITVDLAKASTEALDLTNTLNPRVGDGDLKLPFHIVYGEADYDMRGKSMDFLAEDSEKKKIHVSGTVDESTKDDDPYTGNVTFTFPAGTFKNPGTYDVDKTMFRVVNADDQTVISTVNVKMTVLSSNSDIDGSDNISYDSRMEKVVKDFTDKGKAALDDAKKQSQQAADDAKKAADDYLADVKKQGQELLDEIKQTNAEAKGNVAGDTAATAKQAKQLANDNAGSIHDLQGEVGDARGRFMTLSDRENKQDFNIERKEDKANANANYAAQDLRNNWQDKEIAKKANLSFITDYLSRMRLYPEGFNDDAELKKTYPEGKPGIFVTIDTGHKWIWSNNQWNDCGPYQTSGFPRADVPISIIAYFDSHYLPKWDNDDPEGHIDFSSITGIQIRGQQSAYFTQEQVMKAFDDTQAAVVVDEQNQIVSGTDFTLLYDSVTQQLQVTNLNGVNLDGGQTVLWAHYYANNVGLLVDNALEIAYHTYSQTYQFWTAYLAGGYNLDYEIWANDPDLYFPANVELYSPDNQYEITRDEILTAAKAATGIVTVDDNNHIHGDTFNIQYNLKTKKIVFKKAMGGLDQNSIVLFLHHYSSVNAGMLVDTDTSILVKNHLQQHPFWTAYLENGYNLNYQVWNNDPDLYFPANVELYSPNEQYEITRDEILTAAKAATGIVTVDDNNHIHGDTFNIQFNLKTKKVTFKKAMGGLDKNNIVLFLHHYLSVNAGMLVDTDTPILIKNYMQQHQYWTVYLAGGAKLGLTVNNVNPDLHFNGDLEIYSPDKQYEVKRDEILAAAKAATGIVTVDDKNYIHGDTFNIQFNLKTKKIVFKRAMGGLDQNSIVLFLHHYSSVNAGPLMDYYLSQGSQGGTENGTSLPAYWQNDVSEAIDRVNTNMGEAGPSGLTVLFITDQHWDGNQKKSAALVHDVMSKTGIQLMANGGDLINQGGKPAMRTAMTSAIESVQYPGVFMATIFGNHDSNWVNVGDQHQHPERQFSHNDVYGYMMSPMIRNQNLVDDFHFVNANQDFTYTFSVKSGDGQVWRWICADTGTDGPVNTTSCQKIAELLEKSTNEKIIMFAHIWTNNGAKTQFTKDIEKLIDARNKSTSATVSFGTFDFSNSSATSKVIMALGGHEHSDSSWTTEDGVPFVLTDSDNADRSESTNNKAGTIGEQCFDVLTIDPVAKQIKAVRVGRGKDRQISY